MADVTVRVDWVDHNLKTHPVDIPQEDYDEGPPEIEGRDRVPFLSRDQSDRDAAWADWFRAGHNLDVLVAARDLARSAEQAVRGTLATGNYNRAVLLDNPVTVQSPRRPDGQVGMCDVVIDRAQFEVGPPDHNRAFDPSFFGKDLDTQRNAWAVYLAFNPLPDITSAHAQYVFMQALDALEQSRRSTQVKLLSCLCVPEPARGTARKAGFVLAGLVVAGGIGAAIWALVDRYALTGTPGSVTATPTTVAGKNRVTVSWTAPATGPAPTRYLVTLTPRTGSPPLPPAEADAMLTSTTVAAVPDGTYDVTVVAYHGAAPGGPGSTVVTLPAPPVPPALQLPDPPVSVELDVGLSNVTSRRALAVTWAPATTGGAATGFSVVVAGIAPAVPGTPAPADAGATSSWYDRPAAGTYQATVTASNDNGTSDGTTSGVLTVGPPPTTAPGAPTGLATHLFVSRETGKPALTVTWEPPAGEVGAYLVTVTGLNQRTVDGGLVTTFDPVPDGTATISVGAYNDAGGGTPATTTVTVDHTKIDPDAVDWNTAFGTAQVSAWEQLRRPLAAMDEQTEFWPHILTVLEDKAGDHGGVATLGEQLLVATLLAQWLTRPKVPPTQSQVDVIAGRLEQACTAPAPTLDDDPLAFWRAAVGLLNDDGTAPVVLRHKLFGIARALERHLARAKGPNNP